MLRLLSLVMLLALAGHLCTHTHITQHLHKPPAGTWPHASRSLMKALCAVPLWPGSLHAEGCQSHRAPSLRRALQAATSKRLQVVSLVSMALPCRWAVSGQAGAASASELLAFADRKQYTAHCLDTASSYQVPRPLCLDTDNTHAQVCLRWSSASSLVSEVVHCGCADSCRVGAHMLLTRSVYSRGSCEAMPPHQAGAQAS